MNSGSLANIVIIALFHTTALATDTAPPLRADLWSGVKQAIIGTDQQAESGRCVIADLSQPAGQAFLAATPPLLPGVYQALLHIKISTHNSINTAPLAWVFTVDGDGTNTSHTFNMLSIEKPRVYQSIPCTFVITRPGKARVSLSWRREPNGKEGAGLRMRAEKSDIPTVAAMPTLGDKAEVTSDLDLDAQLATEPPLDSIRYLFMAIDKITIIPTSTIDIAQLEVDKIRYKPGEQANISVTVRNLMPAARTLKVEIDFVHDLDTVIPVDRRTLQLAAGTASSFECTAAPFCQEWGYAIRCRILENDMPVAEKSDYFTVHSNLWAVLMAGRAPAQFTAHVNRTNAVTSAQENKRRYRNFVESGFWAPDENGDFTPDTEFWWSGQGCYYGSISGTRTMIKEGHKRGLAYAVYANIWGGDGPPAFEQVRAHPDWGHPSQFNVEWFDRWNRNTMGTGKGGVGMHVWPLTVNNFENAEVFKHHGRELIGTHKMFGWDAVRYDSHEISDGIARVVDIAKKVVHAEIPGFQFGYNSSVPQGVPNLIAPFKAQCEGGGLIMEEATRGYGAGHTYKELATRILDFKDETRRYGGHFVAIGLDKCFLNDLLYQYLFWFAANTHMCFDWPDLSVANYPQFATRYAGLLWDLNVTSVTNAKTWLELGSAESFLWMPERYIHQRDLGKGHRQFIIHLINAPTESSLYTYDDAKLPPPRENIALSLTLPGKATVRNVWLLTAEPELSQTQLPHEIKNGRVSFTVPRLRFWDIAVVDLENAEAF